MNTNIQIPYGYKPSPLGIIPKDWEVKRLGDCFNISAGRDLEKDYYSETITPECRYPIFSNSLENKGLYGYTSKPRHYANSITITGRGSLGHAEYRDSDFDAIIRLLVLTPKIDISCELITNYINFAKPFIYESTGVPQLTAPQIQNTLLLLPPYEEQLQIMCFIKLWDTAIAKQTALIEQLTLRKRGLMQQLLTGKKRLKGFEGEWKDVRLGDIGDTYSGLINKNKDDFEEGNAHYIPYMNVFSNEKVDTNNLGQVKVSASENQTKVKYGDIFFTVSSETPEEVGMASVLLYDIENTYLNSFCFGYRPNGFETLLPVFASYLLRENSFRKEMYKIAQGSTRFNISKNEVMDMRIALPSINEQNAIASVLVNADKEIEIQKQKLAALQEQKKGLMQVLLTGKRRVKT